MFDPGGSPGRLRACPILGTWCALLCGEALVRALDEVAVFFRRMIDSESLSCRRGTGESFTSYVSRSIGFSAARLVWKFRAVNSHEGERMSGMNGCQGMPWSEKLDDKKLRGALGGERDLELRGSAVSWNIIDLESTHFSTPFTTSVVLS